ncbi:hypothetical protein MZD04_gp378 [Pseudomonas phage Psa21]|uniref:Uncharacterized protein n=1 Tax=Pseudomonas phage Psa21 TaxID=2530023 RepID=A0A481W6M0_9CAUD|nr:hypothetical protein MZD04_gp378 [Pseudomonas phage Psa21]QBJ02904.1 hypothetical protein PSA21_378 [Pseudomonas phage Psa21]
MNHQHYLTHVYPMYQAYFPGGIYYRYKSPMVERLEALYRAAEVLINHATDLGCSHLGLPNSDVRFNAVTLLERVLNHHCPLNDRKKWLAICKEHNVQHLVNTWSLGTSKHDVANWAEFRAALKQFLKTKRTNSLEE